MLDDFDRIAQMRIETKVRAEHREVLRGKLEGIDLAARAGLMRKVERRVAPARAAVEHDVARFGFEYEIRTMIFVLMLHEDRGDNRGVQICLDVIAQRRDIHQ